MKTRIIIILAVLTPLFGCKKEPITPINCPFICTRYTDSSDYSVKISDQGQLTCECYNGFKVELAFLSQTNTNFIRRYPDPMGYKGKNRWVRMSKEGNIFRLITYEDIKPPKIKYKSLTKINLPINCQALCEIQNSEPDFLDINPDGIFHCACKNGGGVNMTLLEINPHRLIDEEWEKVNSHIVGNLREYFEAHLIDNCLIQLESNGHFRHKYE